MDFSEPTIERISDSVTFLGEQHAKLENSEKPNTQIHEQIQELVCANDTLIIEFKPDETYWADITKEKSPMMIAQEIAEENNKPIVILQDSCPDSFDLAKQIFPESGQGIAVGMFYKLTTQMLSLEEPVQKAILIHLTRKGIQEALSKSNNDSQRSEKLKAALTGLTMAEALQLPETEELQQQKLKQLFHDYLQLEAKIKNIYFAKTISEQTGKLFIVTGNNHIEGIKQVLNDYTQYQKQVLVDTKNIDLSILQNFRNS